MSRKVPVTVTRNRKIVAMCDISPQVAADMCSILAAWGDKRKGLGYALLCVIRDRPGNGSIAIDGRQVGSALIAKTYTMSRAEARLLAAAATDNRPIDSFLESMRRIIAGTNYASEHPYLAYDGIHRKDGDTNA